MGLIVGLVDIKKNPPAKDYADKFYQCSIKDFNGIYNIALRFKPNGITVGMCDIAVLTCAQVCTKLHLPSISIESAKIATNKSLMIKAFEQHSVPRPLYWYVNKNKIKKIQSLVINSWPVIVKPVDMAGSRGIFLSHNKTELLNNCVKSSNISDSGNIIIEEYLTGPEISVEILIKNKIAKVIQITDKFTTGEPHFIEIGHSQPANISQTKRKEIINCAIKAANSLNLNNAICHAEMKITNKGPKLIEIGARNGGDGISEQLVKYSTSFDLVECAIKIALNIDFTMPKHLSNFASCIMFIQTKKGVLKKIINNNKPNKNIEIFLDYEIGRKYSEPVDNSGRIGYIISRAKTSKSAKIMCSKAVKNIKLYY